MRDLLEFKLIFENTTVNLSALCNSCAMIAFCSSELIFAFLYMGSSSHNASRQFVSCTHLYSVNFDFHLTPQKINGGRSVESESDTCSY